MCEWRSGVAVEHHAERWGHQLASTDTPAWPLVHCAVTMKASRSQSRTTDFMTWGPYNACCDGINCDVVIRPLSAHAWCITANLFYLLLLSLRTVHKNKAKFTHVTKILRVSVNFIRYYSFHKFKPTSLLIAVNNDRLTFIIVLKRCMTCTVWQPQYSADNHVCTLNVFGCNSTHRRTSQGGWRGRGLQPPDSGKAIILSGKS